MAMRPQVITQGVVTKAIAHICDAMAVLSGDELSGMLQEAQRYLVEEDPFSKDGSAADRALLISLCDGIQTAKDCT